MFLLKLIIFIDRENKYDFLLILIKMGLIV